MPRIVRTARTRSRRAMDSGPPAANSRKPKTSKTSKTPKSAGSGVSAPYHHGALRDALLQAAARVLERDGLTGLTLRAVAREAGVSHAAPTHHFGDLTGLVSELAAIGYQQFNRAMTAARAAASSPLEQALASARAYVNYGQAHPGLFGLMFRTERLDMTRPALREAAEAAFAGLAGSIAAGRQEQLAKDALTLGQAGDIARAWSLVHGFTTLLLDGRLGDILHRLPQGTTAATLLDAMLMAPMGWPPEP